MNAVNMNDTSDTNASRPRLGIIHFLAWITLAAVLFGIDKTVDLLGNAAGGGDKVPHFYQPLRFVSLASLSLALVGIAAFIRWRHKAHPRDFAPGHWILINDNVPIAIMYIVETAKRILAVVFPRLTLGIGDSPEFTVGALSVQAGVYVWAAARGKVRHGWRWIFALLALSSVSFAVVDFGRHLAIADMLQDGRSLAQLMWLVDGFRAVAGLVVAVFALRDALHVRRDWLHGLGVGLVVIHGLFGAVASVVLRFIH